MITVYRNSVVTNKYYDTQHYTNSFYKINITYLVYKFTRYIFAQQPVTGLIMPHQGAILQEAIKHSGISITRIVEELGITRPTIYRKFKDDTLDANLVNQIGQIIGHDFSHDFTIAQQSTLPFVTPLAKNTVTPVLTPRNSAPSTSEVDLTKQLFALQGKYIALLEAYNELLVKVYGPR